MWFDILKNEENVDYDAMGKAYEDLMKWLNPMVKKEISDIIRFHQTNKRRWRGKGKRDSEAQYWIWREISKLYGNVLSRINNIKRAILYSITSRDEGNNNAWNTFLSQTNDDITTDYDGEEFTIVSETKYTNFDNAINELREAVKIYNTHLTEKQNSNEIHEQDVNNVNLEQHSQKIEAFIQAAMKLKNVVIE